VWPGFSPLLSNQTHELKLRTKSYDKTKSPSDCVGGVKFRLECGKDSVILLKQNLGAVCLDEHTVVQNEDAVGIQDGLFGAGKEEKG